MQRTTEDILKELKVVKKSANLDIDVIPQHIRPGHEMAKREANEKLPRLFREYLDTVFKSARGLFPNGSEDNTKQYVEVAKKEGGIVVVDGGEMYRNMAKQIEPSIGSSRDFGVTQLQLLMAMVRVISNDIGFQEPVPPTMTELRACTTFEDLVEYVRILCERAMGNKLYVSYVTFKVADAALEADFAGKVLPVAITHTTSADRAVLASLFVANTSFNLDDADEIDAKYVISTFKKVTKNTPEGDNKMESKAKPAAVKTAKPVVTELPTTTTETTENKETIAQ